MNPSETIAQKLADLHVLVTSMLPQLVERLPAADVQKVRDQLQEVDAALAVAYSGDSAGIGADLEAPSSPQAFAAQLMEKFDSEIARRAEYEGAQLALLHRLAAAVERIAPPATSAGV